MISFIRNSFCRAVFVLAMVLMSSGVNAEHSGEGCLKHEEVVQGLKSRFNETLVSFMMTSNGILVEIYKSPEGNWTMTQTAAGELTCRVGSGTNYNTAEQPVGEGA